MSGGLKVDPLVQPTRGRRSKLTLEVQNGIVALLKAGVTPAAAAPAYGITEQTYKNWCDWGEAQRRGSYKDFFAAVTVARAAGRALVEAKIAQERPLEYAKHVYRTSPEWAPLEAKVAISATMNRPLPTDNEEVINASLDLFDALDKAGDHSSSKVEPSGPAEGDRPPVEEG